jgi:cytochrome c biogenesis protein CcdA
VTTSSLRRTIVLSLLLVAALGAAALAGLTHPTSAPSLAMQAYLPEITLPTVILAGLVDGINPCAFTVLLLFITAMLASLQAKTPHLQAARLRCWDRADHTAAIFLTYLALGSACPGHDLFTGSTCRPGWGAAGRAFGLWMLKDYFLPDLGLRLEAPRKVMEIARRSARQATLPALIAGGFLIGLCTVPCSGAVYLGVLSLLALQPSALLGYGYLLLYNIVFVLPLIVILFAAAARPTLQRLSHWNLHHKCGPAGLGSVVVRPVILATV